MLSVTGVYLRHMIFVILHLNVTRLSVCSSLSLFILVLREVLLSFQIGFKLVNVAVVCAILESISGLEPSSDTTEPGCLELVTVSSSCPLTLISLLMPLVKQCLLASLLTLIVSAHSAPVRKRLPKTGSRMIWTQT